MSDSSGGTPADWSIEATQPHPKHRREGVPYDGAPDLGLYAAPPATDPAGPDIVALGEFGDTPDTGLAG